MVIYWSMTFSIQLVLQTGILLMYYIRMRMGEILVEIIDQWKHYPICLIINSMDMIITSGAILQI